MQKRYSKIGIITWFDPTNCGSALQAYALFHILVEKGFDACLIRYISHWCRTDFMQIPFEDLSMKKRVKRVCINILLPFYYYLPKKLQNRINPFFAFYWKYCRMTPICFEENIIKVTEGFTTIICGSDQIWSPLSFDPIYMLNFCDGKRINKLSYAASIGLNHVDDKVLDKYKGLLQDFSAVSVREKDGADILRRMGINSEVLIDPALLPNADYYRTMERRPFLKEKGNKYAFCYFLSSTQEYASYVIDYCKCHDLKIIGYSKNKVDYRWMENVGTIGPCEFLWLVDHASLVLTNSYHATIFAMLFHVPFFTFVRFSSDDPISQNSRIEQLNSYFDIKEYVVTGEIPDKSPYDFSIFEKRITELREKAMRYLARTIK